MQLKGIHITTDKSVSGHRHKIRPSLLCCLILSISMFFPSYAVEKMPPQLSVDSLYRQGELYYKNGDLKNSIICLQLVAGRYTPESTEKDSKLAVDASFILCDIYTHYLFDTAKGYESILQANRIARERGYDNPGILFNIASIFQTLSQQTGDHALAQKALDIFITCIKNTNGNGQDRIKHLAMANYLLLSRELHQPSLPDRNLWNSYSRHSETSSGSIAKFNQLLYNIIINERAQRYDEALRDANRQMKIIEEDGGLIRFNLVSNLIIFDILREKKASCAEMESQLDTLQGLACRYRHKDAQLLVYKLKWEVYSSGACINYPKATLYADKYMTLKDSLLNFQQLSAIKGVEMSQEIKTANSKMEKAEHRSQLHLLALCLSLVICAIITVFLIMIRNRNRRLFESNRKLYAQTQELLRQDELHVSGTLATNNNEDTGKKKYATSSMTESDKETLMSRIRLVLSTEEEIFSPNFTVARLSELISAPQRDISQVVNETTSGNFITLLNEYRIKEACRRFKKPEYRIMTLEALANSVGFKARSSFIAAFKKYTGLTPSQYKKLSEGEEG